MKAVITTQYGAPDVLKLDEIEKPIPADNEVLVKVHATSVTIGDSRMRSFTVPPAQWLFARLYLGILKPRRKILGMELAGVIESTGKNVTRFKIGDPVFASTFNVNFGAHAEYKCLPEDDELAIKPDNLSFEEAAVAVGGGITALRCLRKANIQPGQEVLIYGASGAVGTNAVQLAKNHYGAEVTAVCSTRNLELVQSLGADHLIDYTQEDFTTAGKSYDLIFDAVAKIPSASQAKNCLKENGIYLNVHRDSNAAPGETGEKIFALLKDLLEAGKVKPVIDRTYSLEEIVEAHRYVDTGRKRGNIAIKII